MRPPHGSSEPRDGGRSIATPCVRGLALVVIGAIVSGCGSVAISRGAREALGSVSVEPITSVHARCDGDLPGVPSVSPGAKWYGFWFTAPIGMVVDAWGWSEFTARRGEAYGAKLAENDVHVGPLVRSAFEAALAERRAFPSLGGKEASAHFELEIEHGLDDGWGMRGSWQPWMEVAGRLVDREGNVLWRTSARIDESDATGGLLAPLRDPERLRSEYERVARLIATRLVDHITSH